MTAQIPTLLICVQLARMVHLCSFDRLPLIFFRKYPLPRGFFYYLRPSKDEWIL